MERIRLNREGIKLDLLRLHTKGIRFGSEE
jgi:hypothetical protein